ncbi:MAG: molybdopterin dinucleotide binding domain-containing protein [Pseudonocardiaceae bacterium]
MVSPKRHAFLNSQYGNAHDKQRVQGEQCIFLHPDDAAERGIVTGDLVRVFNDRGMFQGPAQLDDALMPGLVMANVGRPRFGIAVVVHASHRLTRHLVDPSSRQVPGVRHVRRRSRPSAR